MIYYLYTFTIMTPKDRRYFYLTFRVFLTAVYFFLFAVQVNSRYYSAANFYVYGVRTSDPCVGTVPTRSAFVAGRESRPGKSHLSVDKRFFGKSFIYTSDAGLAPERPVYRVAAIYIQGPVSHLPVLRDGRNNFLRGPPTDIYSI